MMGNDELRLALDHAMKLRLPDEFEVAWRSIMSMRDHKLRIVERDERYNCHAHGLGIERIKHFQDMFVERGSRVLATSDFMQKLISDEEVRIVPSQQYGPEHIVIYFSGELLTHSARVVAPNELLLSKWGPNELFEHRLWEVPASYGNTFKVAIPPSPDRAIELLADWLPPIA